MSNERTRPSERPGNPVLTGDYVPESTPDPVSTRPTGTHPPAAAGDFPDVPGYVVTGEIARGGMGRILAATDLGFDRQVAVKVLLPGMASADAAGRFVREARITGRLAHPGIPPAYELGTLADGSPFLAMKLVRGRTLAAVLAGRPSPAADLGHLIGVFERICQAVGFAHARGVIHRDLKPANVMVGEFGEVQVMDWGLARSGSEAWGVRSEGSGPADSLPTPHSPLLTADGQVMGTPAYMAPEQARGEDVDARADVFALGGILAEVLTGKRTFTGRSTAEVMAKARAGDLAESYARLAGCGAEPELLAVVRGCLAPDPAARPADGVTVATAIAAYRAGVEDRLRTAERERAAAAARETEQRRKRRAQLVAAAAVVLLLAVAGVAAVWRVDEAGRTRERVARASDVAAALLAQAEKWMRDGDADRAGPILKEAEARVAEAGGAHADRLAFDTRELAFLRKLDEVERFRWTQRGTKFPSREQVAEKWAAALAGHGIVPGTTPPEVVATRLSTSPIRAAVLAALDHWLSAAPADRAGAVYELLAAIDPDPFWTDVRKRLVTTDRAAVRALAEHPVWSTQPAGSVAAFAASPLVPADRARALLVRVVAVRPNDYGVLLALVGTYPHGRVSGAAERLRWCQAAVAARPTSASAHRLLAEALADKHEYDEAVAAFEEAIRLDPSDTNALIGLGNVFRERKEPDRAETAFRRVIGLAPTDPYGYANLGALLQDRNDLAGAEAAHRTALRLDGRVAVAHNGLGNVLYARKDYDAAVAAYRDAIRSDPTDPQPLNNLGVILARRMDEAGAAAAYREAIRLDPAFAKPHHGLGNLLLGKNNPAAATAEYREAIRLDPKDAYPHFGLGNAFRAAGDEAGAEAAYREAIRLDPTFALPHFGLGHVLTKKGDVTGAEAAYRECARLDPQFASPHNSLGFIYESRLEFGRAEGAYREAMRLDPRSARAHANLGEVFRKQCRHADAIASYQAALAIQPDLGFARNGLAYCERVLRGEVPTAPPPREVKR